MARSYRNRFILALLFTAAASHIQAREIVLDKIVVRVNRANILKSALETPQLTKQGKTYTLDEMINEELLVQAAAEKHLTPSGADIERHLVAFKIENNLTYLTDEEFDDELKKTGLSLQKYREQIGRAQASQRMQHSVIANQIIIAPRDIEDFYTKNPMYSEEKFEIAVADIDKKSKPVDIEKMKWRNLGWFTRQEVENMQKIYSEALASILKDKSLNSQFKNKHTIIETDEKKQVLMIKNHKERKLKPLTSRYSDIEQQLQEDRREPVLKNFLASLRKKAKIVYP